MTHEAKVTIRNLYPDLSEAELQEAEANLRQYVRVLIRMAERLQTEGRSIADLADLTFSPNMPNVQNERSNPANT